MRIITGCVSRKNGKILADISKIKKENLTETFEEWVEITRGGICSSRDVYKGGQFEIVKKLKCEVLILSAGYGLIGMDYKIKPYSITFSDKYEESRHILVPRFNFTQQQANKEWLKLLTKHNPVKLEPDTLNIFTLSTPYIHALDDTYKKNGVFLTNYKLGCLAKWLGTGANNVNVTFAKHLSENYPEISSVSEITALISFYKKKHGIPLYKKRLRCNDQHINTLLKKGLSLRDIRATGVGCSEKRYRNLRKLLNRRI